MQEEPYMVDRQQRRLLSLRCAMLEWVMQDLGLTYKQSPTARSHQLICWNPIPHGELIDMTTPSSKFQRGKRVDCAMTEHVVNTLHLPTGVCVPLWPRAVNVPVCICVTPSWAPVACHHSTGQMTADAHLTHTMWPGRQPSAASVQIWINQRRCCVAHLLLFCVSSLVCTQLRKSRFSDKSRDVSRLFFWIISTANWIPLSTAFLLAVNIGTNW